MKMLIAGVALASLVAFPAFAQSYDPHLGSGNIAAQVQAPLRAQDAYAQVRRGAPAAAHRLDRHGGARVQSPYGAYGAVTPFGAPTFAGDGVNAASAARTATMRECSAAAAPFRQVTWGTLEIHQYRTCMAAHGQTE